MSFPAELGRTVVLALSTIVGAFVSVSPAVAQKYPHQVVKIIVPTAAGGAVDAFGRGIGRKLEESLGITAVVENKAGANGIIGAEAVAKSPPDGSTLLVVFPSHVINPLFTKTVPYDPLNDFSPIVRIGNIPLILVTHPSLPVNSVQELIALAKSKPGVLTFASGGVGSGGHLSGELFKFLTKTDIVHVVYKGNALGLNDVLGGHVSMMFDTITTGLTHAQQGRLNMLAVTSASRSPLAPDAPTMIEAGLSGFETSAWYALLAPAKTPPDLVGRLNAEINKAFNDPAFREPFVKQGVQFVGGSPAEADAFLRSEAKRWTEVIESTGMKAQ
jgi:tripartite-type tricarboxylate transporter receptor subunit TctC